MSIGTIVYRINFSDGTCYIGVTSGILDFRIRRHRQPGTNRRVCKRMRSPGVTHDVDVLHRCDSMEQALALEKSEIRENANVLNVFLPGRGGGPGERVGGNAAPLTPIDAVPMPLAAEKPWRKRKKYAHVPAAVSGRVRCSNCKRLRPPHEFGADPSRFNGLNSRCRECERVRSRARKKETAEKHRRGEITVPAKLRCHTCGKLKRNDEFHMHIHVVRGRATDCKACANARRKAQLRSSPKPVIAGEHRCRACAELKPHTEFHRDGYRPNGLYPRCRMCVSAGRKTKIGRSCAWSCKENFSTAAAGNPE